METRIAGKRCGRTTWFRAGSVIAMLALLWSGAGSGPARAEADGWSREHLGAVIRQAQSADDYYERRREELVRATGLPGFLLRTESGDHVYITDNEAERLAAGVALRAMLFGTDDDQPYRRMPGGGSELELAMDAVELSVLKTVGSSLGAVPDKAQRAKISAAVGTLARDNLLKTLQQFDAENRARISAEIVEIDRNREWLAAVVAKADRLRGEALPDSAEDGFLNQAGFYVFRFSGVGWRKRFSGYAYRIEGHHNAILKVEDRTGDPKWSGNYWTFPTGVDIRAVFAKWGADAAAASRKACEAPPPLCPCGVPPDIWERGPEYEMVQGPFRTRGEAQAVAGDVYLDNGRPGSNKQWGYDTDRRMKEVESVCKALATGR